ncbi:MAG TPA: PfkB family carbohydrate kinase [Gaiellaceae bacterium]|nr:PfkB family carbohydrate kinase [Gaiellaceae bacterium]
MGSIIIRRIEFDLIAVGEVLLDVTVAELVPGRVSHAPVSVRAGGVPVNAALAAAAQGARTAVVGRVGSDPAAGAIRAELEAAGIEAILAVDAELPTGIFVETGEGDERAISADRGASARLSPGDIPSLEARAVLVSGHALLRDDTAPAARAALDASAAPLVAVVAAGPIGVDFHARTKGANVLFANEDEARILTGLEPREAALALAELYEVAVVTAGAAGAVAVSGTGIVIGRPSETVQSRRSGAGDAFAGVFLVALASGASLGEAINRACEAGRRALVS